MVRKMGWALLGFLLLALSPARTTPTASASTVGATGATHPCTTHIDIPGLPSWLPEGHKGGDEMRRGNAIAVEVWWEGGASGEKKKITVDLFPSHLPGMCLNSGESAFEDAAIEFDVNPDWDLSGDLVYPSLQSLTATTKDELAAGERRVVIVHSYDWRGFFTIQATAQGCEPASKGAPLDSDSDTLPDAYELQTFLWTAGGALIPYDPGSPMSDPSGGVSDDLSDADLDLPPSGPLLTARHQVRGDGLTAWEEYSAVRVGDEVRRTIHWQDQGPNGANGGPHAKEAWIHDEEQSDIFKLWVPGNPFVKDFGVVFIQLQDKNITADGGNAGFVKKHPRGGRAQRVIRLQRADNKDREARLGFAQEFQVGPKPVLINVFKIQRKAADYGLDPRDLADWVVAHEIGHKFSLEHNKRTLARAPELATPDRTTWWIDAKRGATGSYWIPVFKSKGGLQELDLFEAFEPEAELKAQGVAGKAVDPGLDLHGRNHPAAVWSVTGAVALDPAATIKVESHEGNLMDPVPDPGEIPALKGSQLTNAQRGKVNVKSP